MRIRTAVVAFAFAAAFLGALSAQGPKFYPDDPLWSDDDMLDVPEEPAEIELSDLYDRFSHIGYDHGSENLTEAANVNTLDELPDNSWFTNRHGRTRMSIEALVRGPNTGDGPQGKVPWEIFRSKSQGLTPGFQIVDSTGERYVIKFDPLDVPELASGAEVIATKLFFAMGYNTPENHIVTVRPEDFTIRPGTTLEDDFGDERPLTRERFRRVLRRVPRLEDGSMRVTASKYIEGRPLGPFRYYATRSDDPNDVLPHEHRRELRGLRLLSAWTNHDDTRAQNTQDSYVESSGRRFIRHYLMDFGSTFGSGSIEMQLPNLSYQYWLDPGVVKRNMIGFGLRTPRYRKITWPDFPEYESIGRWEAEHYEPDQWRNDYPNPAFLRMTDRDAFWAAKIIMAFTPEELRAVVKTGEYSYAPAEEYFGDVLIARQRKTASHYMARLNPIDRLEITSGGLRFVNLAVEYGFAEAGTTYQVQWSVYDNATDETQSLGVPATSSSTTVALPAAPSVRTGTDLFLLAEVHAIHDDYPMWNRRVGVYLRPVGETFEVVGIERESDPPDAVM